MERLVTLNILPTLTAPKPTYTGRDFSGGTPPSGVYRGMGHLFDNILIIWDKETRYGFTISKGNINETCIANPCGCGCNYVRIGSLAGLSVTVDPNS